jgi:uncharacterized membrane protein (UPF0127 family)
MPELEGTVLVKSDTKAVIADRVYAARSAKERTIGFIGRKSLDDGAALWLDDCYAIHTFFMSSAIDVLFLDSAGTVVRTLSRLRPWRPFVACFGSRTVVELWPGAIARAGVRRGDIVRLANLQLHGRLTT